MVVARGCWRRSSCSSKSPSSSPCLVVLTTVIQLVVAASAFSVRSRSCSSQHTPLLLLPKRSTTTFCKSASTALYVSLDKEEEWEKKTEQELSPSSLVSPLILPDDDDDVSESSSFYDLEYEDDFDYDDTQQQSQQEASASSLFADYTREEADILEEREDRMYDSKKKIERCILVGVEDMSAKRRRRRRKNRQQKNDQQQQQPVDYLGGIDTTTTPATMIEDDYDNIFTLEESLTEMRELIKTAGMEIAGEITQRLPEVNPKTYINSGKVMEANELLKGELDCDTIVFDAELTPGQQKALENAFNKKLLQNDFLVQEQEIKVIDRTALILDIFAQHARTREGKLQVDLALHEYRKPRLTRMWTHLERQSGAGGVGLRGPGERQLEIDKRLLRDRIITLKQKIDDVQKQRSMRRRGRERSGLPILSLVGYTNAGKSSLLNFLTRAGVMAESMLFATLDPTTRKVKLPGYKTHPEVLLTDTVGFIQKLPTHLVAAFRATLEEVKEADVLIHVIDVSNPSWEKQEQAVRSVLSEIGAADKPMVRVLNKIDLLDPETAEYLKIEAAMAKNTVAVSALHGDGMSDMVACIEEALTELLVPIEVVIPYSKGEELNVLHEQGNVETVDYREAGTYVQALVPQAVASRLERYRVDRNGQKDFQQQEEEQEDDDVDWVALGRGRHDVMDE